MSGLSALTIRELKHWYKDPFQLFMSIIQPIIWLILFGKAFNLTALAGSTPGASQGFEQLFGTSDYFSYMSVGMLAFVVLFTTMFGGMSIVWDRRLGFLNKTLSTPVSRGSIILSKVISSVFRSLVQASIILTVAALLGMKVAHGFNPLFVVGVFASLFLMGIGLSSMFVSIAIRSTRWETQMAIMNLLNLPLLFASNALFPTKLMPSWLEAVSKVNPVTYGTDAARQLILHSPNWTALTGDFLFLGAFAVLFSVTGIALAWRYLSK